MKTLLLSIFLASASMAQSFDFQVSPSTITVTVDKFSSQSIQYTQTPVIISLPSTVTGVRAFKIGLPQVQDINGSLTDSMLTPSTIIGPVSYSSRLLSLLPGQSASFYLGIDVTRLSTGQYTLPITLSDPGNTISFGLLLVLTVQDSRSYLLPSVDLLTIPHYASGGQWSTILNFYNNNDTTSVLQVSFYDTNGSPTQIRTTDGRFSTTTFVAVPANGTNQLTIADPTLRGTISGTATILAVSGRQVGVNVTYSTPVSGATRIASFSAKNAASDTVSVGYDTVSGNVSGVALGNFLNYPQVIQMTIYDEGGSILTQGSLVLPPMGQYVSTVLAREAQGHQGIIRFKATQKALSGIGLKFNPDFSFAPLPSM